MERDQVIDIFCRYSPRLKRAIVLKDTREVISTPDDFDIFRRKPLKVDLIDVSIYACKTYKRYKACAKLFTESSNMANPVQLR